MGAKEGYMRPNRRRPLTQSGVKKLSHPDVIGRFAEYAPVYLENLLWPFPTLDKKPLVSGATGHGGEITPEKVGAWMTHPSYRSAHLSLRAEGWVGIDVDDYNGKKGATQLKTLEDRLGVLPETFTSTARGRFSKSRQYFYRVPDDAPRKSKASNDIEVIQRCHRHASVFPTFHRGVGDFYRWYYPDGTQAKEIPSLEGFASLPDAWLDYLARPVGLEGWVGSRELYRGDLGQWAKWLGAEPPSEAYVRLMAQIQAEPHIGHDSLGFYLREIHEYRLTYGESGGAWALKSLHDQYIGTTHEPNPQKEWDDWVRWVIGPQWAPTESEHPSLLSAMTRWAGRLSAGGSDASK